MAFRVSSTPSGVEVEAGPPKRPRGRPRKDDARRCLLTLRHSEEHRRSLEERAEAAGMTPAEFASSLVWPPEE